MGASHMGSSLGAWGSLLTINSCQPLRVNGYDPVGMHHTNCEQVSAPIFAALGMRPQRVAASAVHI
jgi:putative component of membrane protein insertase Oxa1/YidC/SpoIIIJ protein YidD